MVAMVVPTMNVKLPAVGMARVCSRFTLSPWSLVATGARPPVTAPVAESARNAALKLKGGAAAVRSKASWEWVSDLLCARWIALVDLHREVTHSDGVGAGDPPTGTP